MSSTVTGFEAVSRRIRQLANEKELERVTSNAFRRAARRIQSETMKRARTRGVVRTMFQEKRGGLGKIVKIGRIRKVGSEYEVRLRVTGLAAVQETGGQIAPHVIRPLKAPKLAFKIAAKLIVTKQVQHPGAKHPRIPSLEPEVTRGAPGVLEEIRGAVAEFLQGAAV